MSDLQKTIDELKQAIDDMSTVAKTYQEAGEHIISLNQVSSKGLKRVMKSMLSYPNVTVKAVTEDEGALIKVLFDKMKLNLQQYHLVIHLSKLEEQLKQQGE